MSGPSPARAAVRYGVYVDGSRVGMASTWVEAEAVANATLAKLGVTGIEWGYTNTREIAEPFDRRFEFWPDVVSIQ